MANTYTQVLLHIVFAIKNRKTLIMPSWKEEMEKYISGIISYYKHKLLAISSMPDHIHILIGYNVNQKIPDLVENIKTSSNQWINSRKLSKYKFEWQNGYGVFSHSRSNLDVVVKYILNQEEHHKKVSFKNEYYEILKSHSIPFEDKYVFDFFEYEK
jgi:REP element-mobilizing transposase RayT